ncbi:MAG: hypothetical protein WC307_05345 [Candidatus Nanoarchaeia archaeon]
MTNIQLIRQYKDVIPCPKCKAIRLSIQRGRVICEACSTDVTDRF